MSGGLNKTSWEYVTAEQADGGLLLVQRSSGNLFLKSDFGNELDFKFVAWGASFDPMPLDLTVSGATKDMLSEGLIYSTSPTGNISIDDIAGSCIIVSVSGSTNATFFQGASGTIMLFSVSEIIKKTILDAVTGGLNVGISQVFGTGLNSQSCSAVLFTYGEMYSTPQISISVLVGDIDKPVGKRGSELLTTFPWKVSISNKEYTYLFFENGKCYSFENPNEGMADDSGSWNTEINVQNRRILKIKWNSGASESWNIPISLLGQKGTRFSMHGIVSQLEAQYDQTKLMLLRRMQGKEVV